MPDPKRSLTELEMRGDFIRRHIDSDHQQIAEMLESLGLDSLGVLVDKAVPASLLSDEPLDLPPPMSEREVLSYMRRMRERNKVF
ncbi:MAG TPA: hypothetical protein VE965_04265, partial [Gammaproteobacteria bacterium]|nr:hypothetical protein [Gammaproteobacteria bacterium]